MTKVDIFSGFLGAGKTTLIKKLISEAYAGEKLVLIENEFGEIGIDGGFMKEAGIQVNELNSGCICCSLVGDFHDALQKVVAEYAPDRILIEPSGVGKLSDIIKAVANVEGMDINSATAVADASKYKLYAKNFGEFYSDQIKYAGAIVLSRTSGISQEKLDACVALLRTLNEKATIITTPWEELDGKTILAAMEKTDTLEDELKEMLSTLDDDDDECDDPDCECHHHHDGDEDEHEHHHHHHHHHDGDDDDDDDHDADEVFVSWGTETSHKFTEQQIEEMLNSLEDDMTYGIILRAKGIVASADGGKWIHFDYTPGEVNVRRGTADVTGRICVIGSQLKEEAIGQLFNA